MVRWVVKMYTDVASDYKFMRCGGVKFIKKKREKGLENEDDEGGRQILKKEILD